MKIMNLTHKKEDAVSPVIGVMLMLVVTIVIAAVVAAFAGGLATETESAPVAVLDVDVYKDKIVIRHLSGDNLQMSDTSIKVNKLDGGDALVTKGLSGGTFSPGMTKTINDGISLSSGTYVEVVVLYEGKHILLTKEILVKA